ncbi:MAG: hypothetical protein R3F20_07170 [Planctomycetota bacterium]
MTAFLKGLVTRHLLAKFFALIFAVVTVYLVNRELEAEWYDQLIPVVPARDAGQMIDNGQPFISLSNDPDVYVTERIESVRLRITGSAKDRDLFRTRPMIELRARSEWVDQNDDAGDHGLVDSDFRIPMNLPSVKVEITEKKRVKVDRIVSRDDALASLKPPERIAGGKVFDPDTTRFEPAVIHVEGPASWIRRLATRSAPTGESLEFELAASGQAYQAGPTYDAKLARRWQERGIRILGPPVKVVLGARAEERDRIEFPNFEVRWRLRKKDLDVIARGELELSPDVAMECTLVVEGPRSTVEPWKTADRRRELANRLAAVVDPTRHIDELLPGNETGPSLPIIVDGVPDGLEVRLADAKALTCRMKRLKKGD